MSPKITGTSKARQRHDVLGVLAFERAILDAAAAAFKQWLPQAEHAVFGTLTAAIDPDPNGVFAVARAWREVLELNLLPVMERLMVERMVEHMEASGVASALPPVPEDTDAVQGVARTAIYNAALSGASVAYAAPGVRDFQQQYLAEVTNRLIRVPDQVFDIVRGEVNESMKLGESNQDRSKRIRNILTYTGSEEWPKRAITIARTEATGAYNAASIEAAKVRAVEYDEPLRKVWLAGLDGRTRDSHWAADGQIVPLDGKFKVGRAQLSYPGDPRGPAGEVINCFTGDMPVHAVGVEAIVRTPYSGPLVSVHLTSGRVLAGSPNHPMLTERGWVRLGELNESDRLVGSARLNNSTPTNVDPDVQGAPATFEELYRAATLAGVGRRVGAEIVDFYGDRPSGEIDVVPIDGELRDRLNAAHRKQFCHDPLVGRGVGDGVLPASGAALQVSVAADLPPHRVMGGSGQPGAILRGSVRHALEHGGATVTDRYPGLLEASTDNGTGEVESLTQRQLRLACEVAADQQIGIDHMAALVRQVAGGSTARESRLLSDMGDVGGGYAELLCDISNAVTGGVAFDNVLSIEVSEFSGHLYTLQTESGVYLSQSYINRNCRCTMMELGPDDGLPEEIDRHTERGEGDATVRNRKGSQQDEINRRAERGVIRARDAETPTDAIIAAGPKEKIMAQHWRGVLAPLGVASGDGRILSADATVTFRNFPLPLMWQKQSSQNHESSYTIGSIRSATVEDGKIIGEGVLFDSAESAEAAAMIAENVARPSVDLCDVEWETVDGDGNPVSEEDIWDAAEEGKSIDVLSRFNAFTVMAATLVATPALPDTGLELTEETENAEQAGTEASIQEAEVGLVAAAAPRPSVYATELFEDPRLTGVTPLHMREDGRIVGHLALWRDCHMGVGDACVMAPRSQTGYSLFHVAEVQTGEGPLAVGKLTVGGGHADSNLGVHPTVEHYDNAGTAFALVRAGEDEHGIWVSGVPASWASTEQVQLGLSCPLSGDWRRYGGNLELVAALSVNTPGFPVPRGRRDENGRDYALVAAGAVPLGMRREAVDHGRLRRVIDQAVRESVEAAMASISERSTLEARMAVMQERADRIKASRVQVEEEAMQVLSRRRAEIINRRVRKS